MLRLFVNTLTAEDQCSCSIMQKLQQQFQAPLSQKQKIFSAFLIEFVKCACNLQYFFKKDEYPSLIISDIIDFEKRWYT